MQELLILFSLVDPLHLRACDTSEKNQTSHCQPRDTWERERNLDVIFVKSHTWPLPAYTERNSGNKARTNRSLAWKRMKMQLTPETVLSVPMSKYQMKFKEQGKQLTSSAPTFFPSAAFEMVYSFFIFIRTFSSSN